MKRKDPFTSGRLTPSPHGRGLSLNCGGAQLTHEIIDHGGHPFTRAEAIPHMQSLGLDRPCIDRWLQGNELAQRLRACRERISNRLFLALAESGRRPTR